MLSHEKPETYNPLLEVYDQGRIQSGAHPATTITCNNPVLHSLTLLFYFPSTVYQTLHLF